MRIRPLALGAVLALIPLLLTGAASKPRKTTTGVVKSAAEAKAIAERDTGGEAVRARRIPLNGASGGWEVEVRMPGEDRGWRCVIDADTRSVHRKTRIDQPGAKGKGESSLRVVKGVR